MLTSTREFYLHTSTGDILLVEIFEENGIVTVIVAGKRVGITKESAYELADSLLMAAHDA